MKKTIISTLTLLLISISAFTQTTDWVKEYYVYGYYDKQFTALTKDSLGNIFLSGKGQGLGTATWGSNIYKLDSNGDVLFCDTAYDDKWNSLQLYDGSIYTMGTEFTKRDMNGNLISQQDLIWVGSTYLQAEDAKILDGFLYAIIFGDLIKYDLLGNQIWNQSLTGTASHRKLSVSNGYIYILSSGFRILKYDTLGNQLWNKAAGCMAYNIYADSNSNCYVFGSNLGNQGVIVKLDATGNSLWSQAHDSIYFKNGMVYNDTLYACGGTNTSGTAGDDERQGAFVRLSASTGLIYSSNKYNFFTGMCSDEYLTHIYADVDGIYLGGYYCGEGPKVFLAKLGYPSITTSITEIENSSALIVYPNPTKETFEIIYSSTEKIKLQLNVFSSKGENIYSESIPEFKGEYKKTIDLSDKSKGIYFIEIIADKKKSVKKIVLN